MTPPRTGAQVNQMLEQAGMQLKGYGKWDLTPLGRKFGTVAVKTIGLVKWRAEVIDHLQDIDSQIG